MSRFCPPPFIKSWGGGLRPTNSPTRNPTLRYPAFTEVFMIFHACYFNSLVRHRHAFVYYLHFFASSKFHTVSIPQSIPNFPNVSYPFFIQKIPKKQFAKTRTSAKSNLLTFFKPSFRHFSTFVPLRTPIRPETFFFEPIATLIESWSLFSY